MDLDKKHIEDISDLKQQIKQLKEENEYLKSIQGIHKDFLLQEYALNNSIESIVIVNASGEILYMNDSAWKKIGYTSNEMLHKHIGLLDPNVGNETWPLFWSKLREQKTFTFFSHHKRKDGELFPVEVTATYILYNNEEYVIGFAKDIRNIKAAEEIIIQTELILETIMANGSESIALSSVEGENKYKLIYINTTNLEHINNHIGTNYTERDLIGKMHDDLFINFYKSTLEDLEIDNKKRQEAITQKKRIVYEESYRLGNDTLYLESCVTPIFDSNGTCTHTLWSARDISERKKIEEEKGILFNETLTLNEELKANEEELRQILDSTIELNSQIEQSELKLRAIFDSSESINYLIDKSNKVLWFNKPANETVKDRLGLEIQVGNDITDYIYIHLHTIYHECMAKALTGEKVVRELELNPPGNNAQDFWIQLALIPVYKKQAELIGVSMTITNITERRKREEELKTINRELIYQNEQLNQYSYIVSHNLRGPIATLLGITNVYQQKNATPELKEELINHIEKSTRHLDTIIRDLNTILSQTKETDHAKELVNLESELAIIIGLYKPQIEKSEAIIESDLSHAPTIVAIKSFIHSIFSNLISNSIKYKREDVPLHISISSERIDDNIIITHTDNGLGIDLDKHKDKIFGFYKRFHSHVEGKGIGLHLIKTQVEMMGGRIDVHSEVNKGTTFIIILRHQ